MGLADALANYSAGSIDPGAPTPAPSAAPTADNLPSTPAITADVQPNPPAPSNGGALAAALQPSPSSLPKFQRTFANTLKGMLLGFAEGNLPGMIEGAVNPQQPVKYLQQQRQIMDAQTADIMNRARINEINLQNLPQEQRDQHDAHVLDFNKYMTQNFGAPDQVFDNTNEAAHEALTNAVSQAQASGGKIPVPIVTSDSKNTYVWNAAKAAQSSHAYDMVRQAGILNGDPRLNITSGQWDGMSDDEKKTALATAGQILAPVAPSVDAKTRAGQIQTAQRQLATVNAMPQTADKSTLLPIAQRNLDILNTADNDPTFADKIDEDQRSTFLQGIQSSNLPPDLKKTYTNFVNQAKTGTQFDQATKTVTEDVGRYQTGIDAARQKAADKAADTQNTVQEWKPKVTADEKKKAELSENIAFNANEVNNILARRPDLVGSIAGRFTNVQQMIGNNDPDISAIGNEIHNIAMANSGVHGFRSQEGVQDTENNLLNHFKNGPAAVAGALKSNTDSVQTFIDDARPDTYGTHSKNGGAVAYWQKQQQGKPQTTAQSQGRAVRDASGKILGYTTDGKTMVSAH